MKPLFILLLLTLLPVFGACGPADDRAQVEIPDNGLGTGSGGEEPNGNYMKLKITAAGTVFLATMADNPTAAAFAALLPLTVTMNDLNANEKYYYLPSNLPTAPERYQTIRSGDVMLYGPNCIVLFYKTLSSGYSYNPVGRVDDPESLAATLRSGDVTVTFELAD